MEDVKERKIIMWLMILTTRYESILKVTIWNGADKFMSVKIHVLKKVSASKLDSGIHKYSAKQNIAILPLSACAIKLKGTLMQVWKSPYMFAFI